MNVVPWKEDKQDKEEGQASPMSPDAQVEAA